MCLRSPGSAFCVGPKGRYNSTLTLDDSHRVIERLAFQIVKERYSFSTLIPRFEESPANAVRLTRNRQCVGGAGRDRTDDPLLAKQVLSQLSYGPAAPEVTFRFDLA